MVSNNKGEIRFEGKGLEINAELTTLLVEFHRFIAKRFGKKTADLIYQKDIINTAQKVIDNNYDSSVLIDETNLLKHILGYDTTEQTKKDILEDIFSREKGDFNAD